MSADNTSPTVNQGTGGSSAWKVDGNGGTFPVSGSVTVSGTVTADQGTAGASAWKVDGTGGTFPVSGSVTVSSGSVTVNNAAGASAVNIQDGGNSITVDGSVSASVTGSVTANAGTNLNTSLLQLDATGAKLNLAQGSTTSTQTGPLVQGAVTTSAPSYTNAQTSPLSLTTGGLLRVDGTGGSFPVSGSVTVSSGTVSATLTKSSVTAAGGSFASSGNNTVITPSNSLHLSYISLSAAAANTAAVICIVKFTTGGSTLYEVQLLPGAIWAHNIGGGSNYVTGTSGQALVVNLDSAQTVYYSIEYADV